MTSVCARRTAVGTRLIRVPGLPNVRDTGGLRGPGGSRIGPRVLLRGPAPGPQTSAAVFALGIRTIVDLRHPDERRGADLPHHVGTRVLRRPLSADMTGIRGVCRPQPHAYLAHYRLLLPQAAAVAAEIIDLIAQPATAPVYVCCTFGKDRTGVVSALVLRALRVRLVDVGNDYALTARCYRSWHRDDPLPEWAADYRPADLAARTVTAAHTMRLLLVGIEQAHHDLRSYLEAHGLQRSAWSDAMRRMYRHDLPELPEKER
ncbi:tyrosine-protein phosphatase [Mycobacterium haemophilum]|uniref:tyrosine-protein phosphatase n=1 Tax=Mycobacterium haemophilum TaxID=29311 RepID=UPI00069997AD|nr:tyrosine-protein phosphatase [Mycobacterium haemophilum]